MDPFKAHKLGVKAADVEIVCSSNRYNGKWIVRVMDGDREHVLTESASPFEAARWKARLVEIQT